MATGPLIGIPMQTLEPIPGEVPRAWVMGQRYVKVVSAAGGIPFLLPCLPDNEQLLRTMYAQVSGLFLTGGVDIDPSFYGAEKSEACMKTDWERDWTEQSLIRWAIEDHKPVLGVCRGIQIMNVACGGTLHQDLTQERPGSIRHDYFPQYGFERSYLAHPTRITEGTRLADILKEGEIQVNSIHHQAIKDLAPHFRVSAHAPDGVIEAFEGTNGRFLVGIQWHPEEMTETDEGSRRLFEAFIQEAIRFQANVLPPSAQAITGP